MGQDLALSHTQKRLFINHTDTLRDTLREGVRGLLVFIPKILH